MKKMRTLVVLMAMVAGLNVSVVGVMPAAASLVPYGGGWYTTDGDTNFFNVDVYFEKSMSYDFKITNESNTSGLTVIDMNAPAAAATVYFTMSGGNIWASLSEGGLDLGTSGYFWMSYGDLPYGYNELEKNKQYTLSFDSSLFYAADAAPAPAPVPIPGAALLLASGMLGLGWLKRRRS